MNVCIIGTGYVGLVTGASLAYLGHNVTCLDIDVEKIKKLQAGISPIYEPGIEELIKCGKRSSRLQFTTDLNEAIQSSEIIFIAVGTPPLPDGNPDLQYVRAAAHGIGHGIVASKRRLFRCIINKSTVPVGSGNWVEMLIREQMRSVLTSSRDNGHTDDHSRLSDLADASTTFTVVSNPEFLREGTAISDLFYPDRIVVGANDQRAFSMLRNLYQPLLEQNFVPPECIVPRPLRQSAVTFITTDLTSAEMIKYAANAFLAMKISFANEMANICEQTGADITDVSLGIGLDSRIGTQFLNAGVGWGGSCFGKDTSALIEIAREYGYQPELLKAVKAVNERQRRLLIQKLQGALKIIKGRTIGLLGLAFKPDTDDVRDSPSFDIASGLIKMGARVKAYDPVAMKTFQTQYPELDLVYEPDINSLATECDALVIVTEWKQFRNLHLESLVSLMSGSVLIDGRNMLDPREAINAGFRYIGIGRELFPSLSSSPPNQLRINYNNVSQKVQKTKSSSAAN